MATTVKSVNPVTTGGTTSTFVLTLEYEHFNDTDNLTVYLKAKCPYAAININAGAAYINVNGTKVCSNTITSYAKNTTVTLCSTTVKRIPVTSITGTYNFTTNGVQYNGVALKNTTITADTKTMTFKTSTGVASFTGSGTYVLNTWVTPTATASTGYTLSKYNGTNGSGGTQDWTTCAGKTTDTDHWGVSRDRTITAYATINKYTMTFKTSTGVASFTGSGTYDYNTGVSATATASTGYVLTKYSGTNTSGSTQDWTTCAGKTTDTDTWTATRDRTITAYAAAKTYTLTYDANGGLLPTGTGTTMNIAADQKTGTATVTYASDSHSLHENEIPIKQGYLFTGWWTAASGGTQIYNAQGQAIAGTAYWDSSTKWKYDGNATLYAQWKKNSNCKIKDGNTWKDGMMYVNVNGVWKLGTIWVKTSNGWKQNT